MTAPRPDQGLSRAALGQLVGSVIALGGAWPITKYAVPAIPPLWFAVGRAALAAISVTLVLALLGRLRRLPRREVLTIVIIACFQIGGFFALTHIALPYVPAGRTAILSNVTTIFIPALALLVLHEHIPPARWLATALGLAGVVVLAGPWSIDWSAPGVLFGHALLLSAALCWSVAIILLRLRPPSVPMLSLLPWSFGLSALMLLPLALSAAPFPGPDAGWGPWLALGFVGLIGAPIGTWCALAAQASLPAVVVSIGFLATPATGIAVATLWLGEPLGWDLITGGGLILLGVLVATVPRPRRR
jgi:drug/metabolite transporter (DMT)-like permease